MNGQAVPKPERVIKEPKTLQRKTSLQARTSLKSSKKGPTHKNKATTPIPDEVMSIVRARSEGYDELDGMYGANQGHHIKHRSRGGLDIPINILHVSERNHPDKLHNDAAAIEASYDILKKRILNEFTEDRYYTVEQICAALQTLKPSQLNKHIVKGFLKATYTQYGYLAPRDAIIKWLLP
jgi:hypothetical protein